MMVKKSNISKKIIIVLFLLTIIFMTVGFAVYNKILDFEGTAIIKPDGKVYISNVEMGTMNSATASPEFTDSMVDFNLSFTTAENNDNYSATFYITITNDSSYDYLFALPDYVPRINRQSNGDEIDVSYIDYRITGILAGDTIPLRDSKTYTVEIGFTNPIPNEPDTYVIDGEFTQNVKQDTNANIIASVDGSTIGDLTGNNEFAHFKINVINTFSVAKDFYLSTNDSGIIIKGADRVSDPRYTIEANSENEFDFYLTKVEGAEYLSGTKRVNVLINPEGLASSSAGRVSVLVDQNSFYTDVEPPLVSAVTASPNNSYGSIHVSWLGTDNVAIDHYIVIAYDSNKNEVKRVVTNNDDQQIDITGFSDNTRYYFVVTGVDTSGNTATQQQIRNATTTEGVASCSTVENYRWVFKVSYDMSNTTVPTSNLSVNRGDTYTATIRAANYYTLPNTITVTMDGVASPDFTYTQNNGSITIRNVTGDIQISGNSTCLVEGTKILLANGKYKNIEDIRYTDLLMVYDHVEGKLTKVYPIWIEEAGKTNIYTKITFSDKSELKVVGNHSLFNADLKKYVEVSNKNEFHIGSNVYKVKDNDLEIVSVAKIEQIKEKVRYYNVVSTQYYNIIANDFLSTDSTSSICNIYGFKDNAIYSDNYYKICNGEKLQYQYVKNIPYYLYKGLNLQNALSLLNRGLDTTFLTSFIDRNTLSPVTKDGQKYFSMTTSLDNLNGQNLDKYLYKEGSIYKLPNLENIECFIDTATKKEYKPGEGIKVTNSIHLEAKAK